MSRILFAWELGGGYGHMAGLLPLAKELRDRGHDIIFVLRDLFHAETILGNEQFKYIQAPVWLHPPKNLPDAVSYAEILFRFGYLNPTNLTGMVKAWQEIFSITRPDLILVDHGPTALLASRGSGIPTAIIGTGFCSPPRLTPLPSIRPWQEVPEARLLESNNRVLYSINKVLVGQNKTPLEKLSDLFNTDEDFLSTFKELDHHQNREQTNYWGPMFNRDNGVPGAWPNHGTSKVFVYLRSNYKDFEQIIKQLANSPYKILIHSPGLPEKIIQDLASDNIVFSEQPVRMQDVSQECDMAICHAGHGTVATMMLAGKPLLMLPLQLEQTLLSESISQYGAGLHVLQGKEGTNYRELVKRLLEDKNYRNKAKAFSKKYKDFNETEMLDRIIHRCEELLPS